MYPIFGRYGSFFLYGYSVVLWLGVMASLGVMVRLAQTKKLPGWLDGALVSLVVGVMGGRIGFVWGQWDYFRERPSEIPDIWQGGLSYHGALLAGLLAFGLWCWWGKRPLAPYALLLAPALALLNAFGWLACYLEGCAYGREAVLNGSFWLRWLTADLPDDFGVFGLRYQTQLIGMLLSLLVFGIVWWRGRNGRLPSIHLFWLTLFGLSTIHILLYFWRGDVTTVDLILNGVLALLSLVLLQYPKRNDEIAI